MDPGNPLQLPYNITMKIRHFLLLKTTNLQLFY